MGKPGSLPPNPYVEVLTPVTQKVDFFADCIFTEIPELKWGH